MQTRIGLPHWHAHHDGHEAVRGRINGHLGGRTVGGRERELGNTGGRQINRQRLFGGVHDLQAIDVLDHSARHLATQHAAITDHVDAQRRAGGQRHHECNEDRAKYGHVYDGARPEDTLAHLLLREALFDGIARRIAYEPARVVHFVHDGIAGVDTGAATDTHVLHTFADINSGGAHLHAQTAIHAVLHAGFFVIDTARAAAARFTAYIVVRDHEGVLVNHHALEACVGAHVLAHLLAHEARVTPGGESVEEHPEPLPETQGARKHTNEEFANGRKVTNEGEAGPQGDHDPEDVLGRLDAQLAKAPGCLIKTDAGEAIAFDLALDPHEDFGIDSLRACITAEQPPREGGEEKQRKGGQHQQDGEIDDVLRPKHHAEDVE